MENFLWLAALMLFAGSFLALASGLGILRLPDFYTRMHAAGISDTLCSALILLALVFHFGMTLASLKVVLILAFMLFTCPTASHALARTARHNGLEPWLKPTAEQAPALAMSGPVAVIATAQEEEAMLAEEPVPEEPVAEEQVADKQFADDENAENIEIAEPDVTANELDPELPAGSNSSDQTDESERNSDADPQQQEEKK